MAQESFVCEECSAAFVSEEELQQHRQQVHEESVGRFACQFCRETFSTASACDGHLEERYTA